MKIFNWNEDKNLKLQEERGVCFEDVLDSLENGDFYGIFENPSANHPYQEVMLVLIRDYPCIIPFVESENEIFLKTIIPDRRFKKFITDEKE